ncbi:MAG: hypothetical protein KJ058_14380 [Thermoanaerobaculia bacterium]|nr:hypothetical protein [Thermoanaerobaculia bacterium]
MSEAHRRRIVALERSHPPGRVVFLGAKGAPLSARDRRDLDSGRALPSIPPYSPTRRTEPDPLADRQPEPPARPAEE